MSLPSRSTNSAHHALPALFAHAGIKSVGGAPIPDVSITSLAVDSRQVTPDCCFVAVRGVDSDGHDFVSAAAKSGASVIVADRELPVPASASVIVVEDTRVAIARLSAAFYGFSGGAPRGMRLVGVTGTNGKTTVAWLLRSIFREAGHRTALLGTIEYDLVAERLEAPLTTPGPLDLCRHLAAAREAGATFGVLEVSSHALDQRRCDGLSFCAAVFTNLSGDHLDYHGSMASYGKAKRRLFDLRTADGVAVVNIDDDMGRTLAAEFGESAISFALQNSDAVVTARIEQLGRRESRFVLCGREFERLVRFPLLGRHNIENAIAAAATAEALGVDPDAIVDGLQRVQQAPGRLQHAEPEGCPFSVLVDYAHTDAALATALQAVRPLTRGRLICVFGCGGDRDRAKRPRMAAAVASCADVAFVTSDNPRTEPPQAIIDEILRGFGKSPSCRVEVEADRRRAIQAAIREARPGDTVLIAGKGHETYQLVGDKVLSFDDVAVARECLKSQCAAEEVL